MFPLVAFPELVQHYAPFFEGVFSAEAFLQFQRYISGLIVSENKTVEGINRLFVQESRNQSSLNRLLTQSPFALSELNQARLRLLDSVPGTQLKANGVLSVDDTLLSHYGQHFEHIAYLYDHAQERYAWAHNLVTLHYSDEATDYPLLFQLWKPAELEKIEQGLSAAGIALCPRKLALKQQAPLKWRHYLLGVWRRHQNQTAVAQLYESKLRIAEGLLQQWVATHPAAKERQLPVTFDTWYTQPAFCRFLDQDLQLPYVGTLSGEDQVLLQSGSERLDVFAQRLKAEHLADGSVEQAEQAEQVGRRPLFQPLSIRYKGETEHYYSYCQTHRLHNFGRHRLVINHRQADLSDAPVFYMSNRLSWQATGITRIRRHRLSWQATGITRIRRHRWPVEVYYEEGKAEGLDQYQLRDFEAIERHVALVAVVYSLLRAAQHDPVLCERLQRELQMELEGSVVFWRRVTQAQSLWSLALFISAGVSRGQPLTSLMAPLLRATCAA